MYKVVCFDLDGTLLTSDKRITESEQLIVRQLKEKKVNIVLVSGRRIEEMLQYAKMLALTDNDYLISGDGQYIYDYLGNEIWTNSFLTKKDLFFIIATLTKKIVFFTKHQDYSVVPKRTFDKTKQSKKEFVTFVKLFFLNVDHIEKIVLRKVSIKDSLKRKYTVHEYTNQTVEILNKQVNKYRALSELNQRYYNLNLESFLYFGDDINDIECFENLPNCVAMSTAPEIIKSKAKYIAISGCDGLGICVILKDIFKL